MAKFLSQTWFYPELEHIEPHRRKAFLREARIKARKQYGSPWKIILKEVPKGLPFLAIIMTTQLALLYCAKTLQLSFFVRDWPRWLGSSISILIYPGSIVLIAGSMFLAGRHPRSTMRSARRRYLWDEGVFLCTVCGHELADAMESPCPVCNTPTGPDHLPEQDAQIRRHVRRLLLKLLPAVLAINIIGGWLAFQDYRDLDLADRTYATLTAQPGPFTWTEVLSARPVCPDDQNGALYFQTFMNEIPSGTASQPNPHPYYLEDNQPLGTHFTPDTVACFNRELTNLAPLLRKIDQLADFSTGRFSLPKDFATFFENYDGHRYTLLRKSAKIKASQMMHRVVTGDTSHLADDFKIILAHGRLLDTEPDTIPCLLRIACGSIALDTLEHAVALSPPDGNALARITTSLETYENPDSIRWAMLGVRCVANWGYHKNPYRDGTPWLIQAWASRNFAFSLQVADRLVQAADDPHWLLDEYREIGDPGPHYHQIGFNLIPSFLTRFVHHHMTLTARLRCARVALAMIRYRRDIGSLPKTLDQLTLDYLPAIPIDPFTYEPLRYAIQPDYAVIYSLGINGDDDGGDLDQPEIEPDAPDCGFRLLHTIP